MTKLSVNINKVATLRNARGGNNPDLLKVAKDIQNFGADGITIHPRPDERHIKYSDAINLKDVVHTELNIEGNPIDKFVELVLNIKPEQVTLVPDSVDVLSVVLVPSTIKFPFTLISPTEGSSTLPVLPSSVINVVVTPPSLTVKSMSLSCVVCAMVKSSLDNDIVTSDPAPIVNPVSFKTPNDPVVVSLVSDLK